MLIIIKFICYITILNILTKSYYKEIGNKINDKTN